MSRQRKEMQELHERIDALSEQIEALREELLAKNKHLHFHNLNVLRSARAYIDQGTQRLMREVFRDRAADGVVLPFADVEFSNYSQHGEDGVLHYIFSLIGETNRVVVEMSAGVCEQCNATNLIINHNWRGILFEGDIKKLEHGRRFFRRHFTEWEMPALDSSWITRDNINDVIANYDVTGTIDLFSLDVDGVDYWLLEALSVVSPRVIIAEAQFLWGPETAKTVEYTEDFAWRGEKNGEALPYHYVGASIGAFVKLGKAKGYRLVGVVGKSGPNIILMRNDVGVDYFPEINAAEIFEHVPAAYQAYFEKCREDLRDAGWVDV
ncbi:MAG: hypothetical protein AAF850_00430 [Pseudomonadota bacterium]